MHSRADVPFSLAFLGVEPAFALALSAVLPQAGPVTLLFYLTLAADYASPSLSDAGEHVDLAEAGLSEGLVAEIHRWNDDYQWVVPLDRAERLRRGREIADLDDRGLALCERIANELGQGSEVPKVGYFSEGQLRHLRRA